MSTPIERIAGYACEVNDEQWRELVKVADEVGCPVDERSRKGGVHHAKTGEIIWIYAKQDSRGNLYTYKFCDSHTLIPYPDFLAKLKGEKNWEPKNGEEVEASYDGGRTWHKYEYLTKRNGCHVCWDSPTHNVVYNFGFVRQIHPPLPIITRAVSEQMIGKRIVD